MDRKLISRSVFLVFADVLILYSALLAALVLRLTWNGAVYQLNENYGWLKISFAVGACLAAIYIFDLYDHEATNDRFDLALRLLQAIGLALAALALIYYFFPPLMIGRGTTLVAAALILGLMPLLRATVHYVMGHPDLGERVVILGDPSLAHLTAEIASRKRDSGLRIIGFVTDGNPGSNGSPPVKANGLPLLGGIDRLEEIVGKRHVDRLVIGVRERRGNFPSDPLLRLRLRGDVNIEEITSFMERNTGQISLDQLRPSWLIFSGRPKETIFRARLNEVLQRSVALAGLVLSLPIGLLAALLIKIDSRGPCFYTQERVGRNGRVFTLIKFRSMKVGAESDGEAIWASANDDRVTRVGRVIRKIRVDEIPQFWNILKGEMRFVGPRPERPEFIEALSKEIPFYEYRHLVKPGLTGWAQINFPYASSIEDARRKLQYDLYYVKNQSIALDITIMLSTIKTILLGRGGR